MTELCFLEEFFDLSLFAHSAIFRSEEPIWNALKRLPEYLNAISMNPVSTDRYPGVYFENPESVYAEVDVVIEPGAYIRGPCYIGHHSTVRHGAYVRGNVLVGDGCIIGHATEVKHSILLNGAKAAHFAFIGDSIIGNRVNLGAGVKCANFRLDHQQISVHRLDQKCPTGLVKLGALLGDDSQIGCNTVLNPGTCCGKFAQVFPSLNIGGWIPPHAVVKPQSSFSVIVG